MPSARHGGLKTCRGTLSGHICIGRCHEHYSGMPKVRCWKGSWQAIEGGCTPDQGPWPPHVGPCGPLSDDRCAADVNAVNGSCTAVSPDSYRCQCMQGYKWSNETSSCLPALAIAIGIEKGSSPQSWWGPVILLWDGVTWKPQAFPLREQGKVEKDDDMGMKLTSVAFTNATTAFVAGSLNGRGYLVKWDGSAWSTVSHYPDGQELGGEARVASAPHISFAVTLSGPYSTWLDHATSDLK
ncbi:hypothetical protein OEZ86_012885 [Tetradesmus obliquus]|nr:hypothetical protein OEZ86_012885 [Tetradesmus obliquus]